MFGTVFIYNRIAYCNNSTTVQLRKCAWKTGKESFIVYLVLSINRSKQSHRENPSESRLLYISGTNYDRVAHLTLLSLALSTWSALFRTILMIPWWSFSRIKILNHRESARTRRESEQEKCEQQRARGSYKG